MSANDDDGYDSHDGDGDDDVDDDITSSGR